MTTLIDIFEHQHSLAKKYNPIEEAHGYAPPKSLPMPIDTRQTQDRLRQFYAYIQEEVIEAKTASSLDQPDEYSDILHFMTEFALIAGVTPERIESLYETHVQNDHSTHPQPHLESFQIHLGLAMNQLKYKPWKQSPKPTDFPKFEAHVASAYAYLIQAILGLGLTPDGIYFKKHKENIERIQGGY